MPVPLAPEPNNSGASFLSPYKADITTQPNYTSHKYVVLAMLPIAGGGY